jgi:hypothetical protein
MPTAIQKRIKQLKKRGEKRDQNEESDSSSDEHNRSGNEESDQEDNNNNQKNQNKTDRTTTGAQKGVSGGSNRGRKKPTPPDETSSEEEEEENEGEDEDSSDDDDADDRAVKTRESKSNQADKKAAALAEKKRKEQEKKRKAAHQKNKSKRKNADSDSDSDSDKDDSDEDTNDDTDNSEDSDDSTGQSKGSPKKQKNKKKTLAKAAVTGVVASHSGAGCGTRCVDSCAQVIIDRAASLVDCCGGGLRKEPPSWLEDDHDGSADRPPLKFSSSNTCLCVQVHGTDPLVQDPYVSSPVVMVHCVDAFTGEYLIKEDSDKPSTSHYEMQSTVSRSGREVSRESGPCQRVMPLLTSPCSLGSRGMYGERLSWSDADGRLLWGEKYDTFVRQGAVFLFEILDVVPKGPPLSQLKAGNGWYRIAWGFLRPVGPELKPNVGGEDFLSSNFLGYTLVYFLISLF